PGWSPPEVYRPGGPAALLTSLCLFRYDRARHRFALESLHPGCTLEQVRDQTGFDFEVPARVPSTPLPNAATLATIAEVGREIAETYPQFAARLTGAAA